MRTGRPELLAPAGSYEGVIAAVSAGADAVYVGGSRFGARAYARNLSEEELLSAMDYLHIRGKQLHLTVNTLLKNRELEDLYEYIAPLYEHGLDAVIVQDLGVLSFLAEQFPGLALHASTQMTVTGLPGVRFLETLGVNRVVLARELSLQEIGQICRNTDLEIECFIHGALCYCYSGQCLMSSLLGGRSGNRGRCAQPCRLAYEVHRSEKTGQGRKGNAGHPPLYLLSPRDICTLDSLPELLKAGVTSLKIEGRMKRAEYTAGVVSIYRKYLDLYEEKGSDGYRVDRKDMETLEKLYTRSGFSGGYLKQYNGPGMMTLRKPDYNTSDEAFYSQFRKRYVEGKNQEKINGKLKLFKGFPATMELEHDTARVCLSGELVQEAVRQPLSREKVEAQLRKTGNTPFVFGTLDIEMDPDVFLPVQELNTLRRDALEQMERELTERFYRTIPVKRKEKGSRSFIQEAGSDEGREPLLTVSVENQGQLTEAGIIREVSDIYVSDRMIPQQKEKEVLLHTVQLCRKQQKRVFLLMPPVFRRRTEERYRALLPALEDAGFDGIVVHTADELGFLKQNGYPGEIRSDYSLYAMNDRASGLLQGMVSEDTVPVELNYKELLRRDLSGSELLVYGYLPLMISAQCVEKNTGSCTRDQKGLMLKDRYRKYFPVQKDCRECINVIYNSAPLWLADCEEKIRALGVKSIRLSFTCEDRNKTRQILDAYVRSFYRREPQVCPFPDFTRGHFNRGVE